MRAKASLYTTIFALLLGLGILAGCTRAPRSDAAIATDIQSKVNADSNVPTKQIQVQADKGVVTLSGTVQSDAERTAAANDAAQVAGVRTVVNNLQVMPQVAEAAPAPEAPAAEPTPTRRSGRIASRTSHPAPRSNVSNGPTGGFGSGSRSAASSASNGTPPFDTATTSNAPALGPAPSNIPAAPSVITVPEGTVLPVRLIETIDSNKNHTGDTFHGTLDSPIAVEGQTAIPAQADVTGRIVDAKGANRITGKPALSIELTEVSYNGKSYRLSTEPFVREGTSRGKRTATTAGGGAALGAIIGAIAGGGKGAAIGAAAGAGAGTGVGAATGSDRVELPSETVVNFRLTQAVTVNPAAKANRSRD